jgi:hypothetical protein
VSIFTKQLAIPPGVDPVVGDLVAACTFDATRRLLGLPENGTTGINPLIIKSKNAGERIASSLTVGGHDTEQSSSSTPPPTIPAPQTAQSNG